MVRNCQGLPVDISVKQPPMSRPPKLGMVVRLFHGRINRTFALHFLSFSLLIVVHLYIKKINSAKNRVVKTGLFSESINRFKLID